MLIRFSQLAGLRRFALARSGLGLALAAAALGALWPPRARAEDGADASAATPIPTSAPKSGAQPAVSPLPALLPPPGSIPPPQAPPLPPGMEETRIDVHVFRVVESYSGPTSYYRIIEDPTEAFIRAIYRPPLETVTLGVEVPEPLRQHTKRLRWKWRAMVLPRGGNECKDGLGDSAAVVYVSWKRGLKWYSLKYVWSSAAPKGAVCDQKRNLFVVQDTIIRQSGPPTGVWMNEEIDPVAEFRLHFGEGNPHAEVPDFLGIGIMSDGDQTKSVSAADYSGFSILH